MITSPSTGDGERNVCRDEQAPTAGAAPVVSGPSACCTSPSSSQAHQVAQESVPTKSRGAVFRPVMDLFELPDRYELRCELPGTTADAIHVTVHGPTLTIEASVPHRYGADITPLLGEFGTGDFRREIRMGEDVDVDAMTARYVDGVLTLLLPKRAERQPRRVPIAAG